MWILAYDKIEMVNRTSNDTLKCFKLPLLLLPSGFMERSELLFSLRRRVTSFDLNFLIVYYLDVVVVVVAVAVAVATSSIRFRSPLYSILIDAANQIEILVGCVGAFVFEKLGALRFLFNGRLKVGHCV